MEEKKVKIEVVGTIEGSEKEYAVFLAKLRLACAEHEVDLFEY